MSLEASPRYDRTTIWLHWLTAGLVLVLWIIGQTADWLPRGPFRLGYWSTHVLLGFALAAVVVRRIVWRAGPGRGLPAADSGLLHVVAKATHYLLYALLVGVVVLGIANALVRGFSIYGLFNLPQLGDAEWKRPINGLHELAANALLFVALFHAAAALVHHSLWRDRLLSRMIPGAADDLGRDGGALR